MPIVTLTTDFGARDWFTGTMKGVILGINQATSVVDITHEIPAGDIAAGAFALAASSRFFPKGTVHVAVIDPGVGSPRKAIAVETSSHFFVGPDNGVLSLALRIERIKAIHALENSTYFLPNVSQTFHGRDVFAPVAAHLSRGVPISKLGKLLKDFQRLSWPEPRRNGKRIRAEVVYIDRFGNGITNIGDECLAMFAVSKCEVHARCRIRCSVKRFYQAVPLGKPLALIGSTGFLEIAINGGSAAKRLGLKIGSPVTVHC